MDKIAKIEKLRLLLPKFLVQAIFAKRLKFMIFFENNPLTNTRFYLSTNIEYLFSSMLGLSLIKSNPEWNKRDVRNQNPFSNLDLVLN